LEKKSVKLKDNNIIINYNNESTKSRAIKKETDKRTKK
jgi:hypothetical protein